MAETLTGYGAVAPVTRPQEEPRAATLVVENMHCGGCIASVEAAVSTIPGVKSARANLSLKRLTAQCDHSVSSQDLIDALKRAGFSATELADGAGNKTTTTGYDLVPRLGVAAFAAMNVMLLSVSVWSGAEGDMSPAVRELFHWLSALITVPAVAYAGQPFFHSALQALKGGRLNMDVPISLGVLLATAMSLFQTAKGTHHVYFDAAITLLAFLLFGRLLDQLIRKKAEGAAANLLGSRITTATVLDENGHQRRCTVSEVRQGDRVFCAPGDHIAADGVIERGASELDESLISGETTPRNVTEGDQVYAGTTNLSRPLTIRATAKDSGSLIAQLTRMMEAAEQNKSRYVRLADRAAQLYAPLVHILGLVTFAGWMLAGQSWEAALTAAIAVLIITCPCALALAVPAVQVAASGRLFSRGILLKRPDGLERLAEVDTVVFDKTGTLTRGELQLDGGNYTQEVLAAAAALAGSSRHPYARAITAAAQTQGLSAVVDAGVTETPGFGLERETAAGVERLGSAEWAGATQECDTVARLYYRDAAGNISTFTFADDLRDDADQTVSRLLAAGLDVQLLSGDRPGPVREIAGKAGIADWMAGCKPDEKVEHLARLRDAGKKTLMAGDGLNDSPALTAAQASMSPSTAADIAQTAADVIVLGRSLAPVADTLIVAKAAKRLAMENFALAITYNAIFVPLAMAGLVTPLIAAVAMSLSSITVTANALRLKYQNLGMSS